ncbi:MAG: hypothetical protein JSV00_05385, partial [bacterium]
QATWRVGKNTSITGQFNHLEAQGSYKTSAAGFSDVGGYSGLDAVRQESFLDLQHDLNGGWGLTARVASLSYEDKESDLEDEKASEISASVSKRW